MSEQLGSGRSHTRVQVKQTAEHNARSNRGACISALLHPSSPPSPPPSARCYGTAQPPKKRHHFLSICAAGRALYKHILPFLPNTLTISHSVEFCFSFSQTPFAFSHLQANKESFSEHVGACAKNGIH